MSEFTLEAAREAMTEVMPGCVRALQPTVEAVGSGRALLRLPFTPDAGREGNIFSGQALAALADTAMCFAVWSDGRGRRPISTVDLHVTFLRGAQDEALLADAELVRSGRSLAFVRATIRRAADGETVTSAVATFALPA
jgi:uncharacterized protein (TIGR00369 family)